MIWRTIPLLLAAFLALAWPAAAAAPTTAPVPAPVKVRILYFYVEGCDMCPGISEIYLRDLEKKYPIEIKDIWAEDFTSYELLLALEKKYQDTQNSEYPIIFFDRYCLSGEKEVMEKMEAAIKEVAARGGCPFADEVVEPVPPPVAKPLSPAASGRVHLAYFHEAKCKGCQRARADLRNLAKRHPALSFREFDVRADRILNEALCERHGVPERWRQSGPMIFVGTDYLRGRDVNYRKLEELVRKYQGRKTEPPWGIAIDQARIRQVFLDRFRSVGVAAILLAGLLDGVNPCAFATMVFFISYLALAGRKGRDLLLVGSAFTAAVFAAYLLIGLGLLHLARELEEMPVAGRVVEAIAVGLAILLGVLSFHDCVQYRRGRPGESLLKLPWFLRSRLNRVIRERARVRHFVLAAIVAGFLVSVLEFTCTGQVYLPTIMVMVQTPEYLRRGILLLVLYNLAFVAPLAVVFLAAYWGVTAQALNAYWERHAAYVKAGLGLLFFALAALLISRW